jgi:hypothetical protein
MADILLKNDIDATPDEVSGDSEKPHNIVG